MLLKENLAKTAHLLNELGEPVTPIPLCGVFQVDIDSVFKTYRGVRIKDLSFLYPEKFLREAALDAAKKFIQHMELQREEYVLAHPEDRVEVWGPYRPTSFALSYKGAVHTKMDDEPFPDGIAMFRLRGWFTARYAAMVPVEADGRFAHQRQQVIDSQYGGSGL